MKTGTRILQMLVLSPQTFAVAIISAGLVWGFCRWFSPPVFMRAAALAAGAVLLLAWPVIYIRSDAFRKRFSGGNTDAVLGDLRSLLADCHPDFKSPALECLALAEKIRQEFTIEEFHAEVEALLTNLAELTRNHIALLDRSRKFGTEEQKHTMTGLLKGQASSVREALTALKRFSGNLTLFESHLKDQKEIDGELKAINLGLQDAIREEVEHG